jgi:hypothetical protein
MLPNFASPATTGDEFSDFPRILHPAARAAKRISDFYRTFHLPAWQEMLLQLTTQLPTENAGNLSVSGVFRVPYSSSDQTSSGVTRR